MTKIIAILRLIRFPNLLIIALLMILMRYCIIQPFVVIYQMDLVFPLPHFILLVLSEVLLAAAGYMINDYFDVQMDTINRPDKVVVGKHIQPKTVYLYYTVLNIIALAFSFYISFKLGMVSLFAIFPVTIGILWFYSTTYKRQLLIGNIIVSAVIAFVPILVVLYELPSIHWMYHDLLKSEGLTLTVVLVWAAMFSFFAFVVNLTREIVKDAEDIEGDKICGRNTLPIAFGITVTRNVVASLVCVVLFVLGFVFYKYLRISCSGKFDLVTFLYFTILIFIPLVAVIVLVYNAKGRKQYRIASHILKLIMLAGILYALVVRFKFLNCFGNA